MKRSILCWSLCWIFCLMFVSAMLLLLAERSEASGLNADTCRSMEFRNQTLKPELYEELIVLSEEGEEFGEILTASMLHGKFSPEEICTDSNSFLKYKKEEFFSLQHCYEAVWADIKYFPVSSPDISFEDSWRAPRDYGGTRFHEGTDLFGSIQETGYYPVISMTDGTIEKIGWLPLGGYRIGIRAPHGGYFYYAHLSEYEKEFLIGDKVEAGDILGYMGNTGYGPEGTAGEFPVHLHLGIYISTPFAHEMSVNPYWVLRAVQKKIRKYTY